MLVLLCLVATALPLTLVEGANCRAEKDISTSPKCLFGTVVNGGIDREITYKLTIPSSSRICCEAKSCATAKCQFEDIGCHKNGNTVIERTLQWELANEKPGMRCYVSPSTPGTGVSYTYTAELVKKGV